MISFFLKKYQVQVFSKADSSKWKFCLSQIDIPICDTNNEYQSGLQYFLNKSM